MSFSDYLEGKVLDHVFGNVPYAPPSTLYIGLSTTDPGEAGAGITEPVGFSYQRMGVANNKTTWSSWSEGQIVNLLDIVFPQASGSWGTLGFFFVSTAATAGTLLASGPLSPTVAPTSGDTVKLSAGNVSIRLD